MKNTDKDKIISILIYSSSIFVTLIVNIWARILSDDINNKFMKILFLIIIFIITMINLAPSFIIGKIVWDYNINSKCNYTFEKLYDVLQNLTYDKNNNYYLFESNDKNNPKYTIKCIDMDNKRLYYNLFYKMNKSDSYDNLLTIDFIVYLNPINHDMKVTSIKITSYYSIERFIDTNGNIEEIPIDTRINSFKWNKYSPTNGSKICKMLIDIINASNNK